MTIVYNPFTDNLDYKGASSGGTGVETITGNDNTPESPIAGNFKILTSNSTLAFRGSAGTQTLNFGISNLCLGTSLPNLAGGTGNISLGQFSLGSITDGLQNIAIGLACLSSTQSGTNNIAIGLGVMQAVNTNENIAIGSYAGSGIGGDYNICIGSGSTINGTGSYNICFGFNSGTNTGPTSTSNILISSIGEPGDSNTLRMGTQGSGDNQINKAFLAGITGVTVSASSVVLIDANGQMSDLGFGTAGQVLTSNGPGVSPSWQ